jgi:hypothetical protein
LKPLAPSPAWTLVIPYCKRTRPGRGTNTKAAGFPPLSRRSPATSRPPFALGLASTHLGWGTRRHSLVGPGTPRSRNTDTESGTLPEGGTRQRRLYRVPDKKHSAKGRALVKATDSSSAYAKGSPREGQAPRTSNTVENCGPSPLARGAPLPASYWTLPAIFTIELPAEAPRASFPLVHSGGRDTNSVVTVSQNSLPTRYNITMAHVRAEDCGRFFLPRSTN